MSKKNLFDPSRYRATKWHTAAEKAEFGDWLCKFLQDGCPKGRWSKKRYDRLMQVFGFIAHYDIFGFWEARFNGAQGRRDTVFQIVHHAPVGDPVYTWSDIERDVRDWLVTNKVFEKYQKELVEQTEAAEREALARLKEKYPS